MSESHKRTERMSRGKKQEIAEILLEAWKRGENAEKTKEKLGLSDDPDVADWMGAFTEDAVTLADLMDDVLLSVNDRGEVFYEG